MKDDEPVTFRRALRAPEFWLLTVTAFGAAAGLQWWIGLPLCIAGLSISALPKYIEMWPRAREVDAEREWVITVALSMFNKLGATCGVYLHGHVVRWIWW